MSEPTSATEPATVVEPQPSIMDVAEIFYAPSAVFARRRNGEFGLPLVVLVVVGGVIGLLVSGLVEPALRADIARGMQSGVAAGKLTAEQAANATATGLKFGSFGLLFTFLLGPFVGGVVIWLAGLLTRARVSVGVGVMIATFSMFPRIIGAIASAALAMVLPESSLTSIAKLSVGPAHFIDAAAHPGMAALLGRLDLFLLWGYVLIAIGVRITARSTRGQAWATTIIAWAILSLGAVYNFVKLG